MIALRLLAVRLRWKVVRHGLHSVSVSPDYGWPPSANGGSLQTKFNSISEECHEATNNRCGNVAADVLYFSQCGRPQIHCEATSQRHESFAVQRRGSCG